MTGSLRQRALAFFILVVALTALIAAGLPRLELNPGLPMPRLNTGNWVIAPLESETAVGLPLDTFLRVLVAFGVGLAILYVIYSLLKEVSWKDMLRGLLFFLIIDVLITVFILLLLRNLPSTPEPFVMPVIPTQPALEAPLGPAPPALIWIVGLILALLAAGIGVWLIAATRQPLVALEQVGLEAEKARRAILSGRNLKNVIVECYLQMSLALQAGQGIERQQSMTTHEFEHLLKTEGVPPGPVHQLTALFEAARYGQEPSQPGDEQSALDCLEAIVAYSRTQGEKI